YHLLTLFDDEADVAERLREWVESQPKESQLFAPLTEALFSHLFTGPYAQTLWQALTAADDLATRSNSAQIRSRHLLAGLIAKAEVDDGPEWTRYVSIAHWIADLLGVDVDTLYTNTINT